MGKSHTLKQMNREEIISAVLKEKIVVILRGLSKAQLIRTVDAMEKGGIRLCEVTFNASGDPSDQEIGENIKALIDAFKGRVHIGAGTVLTEQQVEIAANAGAEFIISPDTNPSVIKRTRELGLVSIPGALTPSEATLANRSGADFVKLFPNSEFRPSYLKAIAVPLSHIRFLTVGGINEENLTEYLHSGAVGVGMASGIVDKKLIAAEDYDGITTLANKYVEAIRQA